MQHPSTNPDFLINHFLLCPGIKLSCPPLGFQSGAALQVWHCFLGRVKLLSGNSNSRCPGKGITSGNALIREIKPVWGRSLNFWQTFYITGSVKAFPFCSESGNTDNRTEHFPVLYTVSVVLRDTWAKFKSQISVPKSSDKEFHVSLFPPQRSKSTWPTLMCYLNVLLCVNLELQKVQLHGGRKS